MRPIQLSLLAILSLFLTPGCSLLPHHTKTKPPIPDASQGEVPPSPPSTITPSVARHAGWNPLGLLSFQLPFFHHHQDPPRAQILQRVGIIQTVVQEGNYVLIKLDPGMFIPPGRKLLVISPTGETAVLKSAENQPPYFNADIESGNPLPGEIVQQ